MTRRRGILSRTPLSVTLVASLLLLLVVGLVVAEPTSGFAVDQTAINAAMAQRAADGGRRFVMADFVGTFQDHLAELMGPDLIHPNEAGRARFAVLVDEALSRCP